MFEQRECIFWTNVVHQISIFGTFHCLSAVVQITVIFEVRSQFLHKLCTILLYLSKNISVKCKWNFLETPYKVYIEALIFYFNAPFF